MIPEHSSFINHSIVSAVLYLRTNSYNSVYTGVPYRDTTEYSGCLPLLFQNRSLLLSFFWFLLFLMNSLDRRTYCNTADRFLPEAVLLPSLYQEKCYIYTYLPCLSFSYQSYGNDSLNLHIMFQTNKKDAESLPRPHYYLALSSLTFDTSLCAASCFTSSTPLASNASALY